MAVKATNQLDIVDLTDGYSVELSYPGVTVPGDSSGNAGNVTNAFTVEVSALCGGERVQLSASSVVVTAPNGITAGSKSVSSGVVSIPFSTTTALNGLKAIKFEVAVTADLTIEKYLPVTVARTGANGAAGLNQATVTLYKRAASASAPTSGSSTYTFATGILSDPPTGWSQDFPAETQGSTTPVWMMRAVASSNTTTDTIGYGEWSTPVKMVSSGSNGDDGLNQATIILYKRAASAPSKPNTAVTYTFATGALDAIPTGWSRSVPAVNGDPCWITQAVAVANTATYTIPVSPSNAWTDPVKLVEDGLVMTIESSAGTVFKNTSAATTLTARLFQGGTELSSSQIAAMGTVKWYRYDEDTDTWAYLTGKDGLTLSIGAGDVTNRASFMANLETS